MVGITQPIIPGVMPIQNFASFRRLVKLCQCPVPEEIMAELEPIKVGMRHESSRVDAQLFYSQMMPL